jgi:hypothetical protein
MHLADAPELVAYDEDLEILDDPLDAVEEYETYNLLDRLRPMDGKRRLRERGPLTVTQLQRFVRRNLNLGLLLDEGFAVVDRDGPNRGEFADLESPWTVWTPRGEHLYFRIHPGHGRKNLIRIGGLNVDVLFNGVTVLPPYPGYRHAGRIVERERLPQFPLDLVTRFDPPEPFPPPAPPPRTDDPTADSLERARRRMEQEDVAVSGNRGHDITFRAACRAVRGARGNYHQALLLMIEWNRTNAHPPWKLKELEHKVRDALKAVFG